MSYTTEQANAIVDWQVDRMSLWINNDQGACGEVTDTIEEMSTFDVCRPGADDHEDCESGEECRDVTDFPSYSEVGERVADIVAEWLEGAVSGDFMLGMLRDILAFNDRRLHEALGRRFYPEDAQRLASERGHSLR